MKKIYLLLLCCVILLCGCDKENNNTEQYKNNNEFRDFADWVKEESEIEEILKNCELKFLDLPETVNYRYSFSDDIKAKVRIDSANYKFYEYDIYSISIKISGEVLYGNNEIIPVNYKLKDNDGNVILTDHFTFTSELSKGDKFKDFEFIIWDIEPGKYTIEFYDCQL